MWYSREEASILTEPYNASITEEEKVEINSDLMRGEDRVFIVFDKFGLIRSARIKDILKKKTNT